MKSFPTLPVLLLVLACLAAPVLGHEKPLSEMDLGKYVSGEKVDHEFLKDRTVVLDFWGVT
jgi:hypothetical protein